MRCVGGNYTLTQDEVFDSPELLIGHYKKNPVRNQSGSLIELKKAINGSIVSRATLKEHYDMLCERDSKGKSGFTEEYDKVQQLDTETKRPRSEGQRPENKKKNRYRNILPFDETRIALQKHN